MRSSSRRLKVTSLAGAGARCSPPRHALGSVSPKSMRRLLCHRNSMIAPEWTAGKAFLRGTWAAMLKRAALRSCRNDAGRCDIFDGRHHGFVKQIIIRPYFGQARAKLDCEI